MNSPSRKDFFRIPTIADQLGFFQRLLEAGEIHADLGLALLKVIHAELVNERTRDRSVYKRYAGTIQILRYHKAELFHQIVGAWEQGRPPKDPEWISGGKIK
jgi:hypothetical protein